MHWELSDEQNLYVESLRDWLDGTATSEQVRSWSGADDQHSFDEALAEAGWAGVGFDESRGGQGGGLLELVLTARELGRSAAPSARWLARALADVTLSAEPDIARAAASGDELSVLAIRCDRIPATGSSVRWHNGTVTGEIPCVLAADGARRFIVPTDTDGQQLVVVDRDAPGVDVRPRALLDRTRAAADILFHEAPARTLEVGGSADTWSRVATRAAVLVAADTLGAAERMLDMTVQYAKQRKQFGRPIAAFQAVKHAAAQMLLAVESSYSVTLFAGASLDEHLPESALHAAAAKAQVTQQCAELADSALTVHGAIGYTWEYDLQLFYKRSKLDRILFGAPEAWNERIASLLPLEPALA